MTPISDERVKQLKDDIDRARHYKLQHVAMSPDEVDALLAEREAAGKVRERIQLADTMLGNWEWNIEHNSDVEPKKDEQLRMLKKIRQALKETDRNG